MRKTLVAAAVAAIVSVGTLFTTGANAITLTAPAGIRPAIEDSSVVEATRYVCWNVRRNGYWVRKCGWRANYGYAAPRAYYGGYRPYYRPYGYYGYGYRRPGVVLRF